jgi:hypothetical protein
MEPNPAAGGKLDDWLSERAIAETLIKQYLSRAVDRMKKQEDKRWSEREFEVGGWVYMKLQPYVQSSALSRANLKLGFKYFGPFKVTTRVGSVAYRLDVGYVLNSPGGSCFTAPIGRWIQRSGMLHSTF